MSEARAPLRRSRSDRVLGGVCGGLGEFFGLKPLWFRIIFVILGILGGVPGLLPYISAPADYPGEKFRVDFPASLEMEGLAKGLSQSCWILPLCPYWA